MKTLPEDEARRIEGIIKNITVNPANLKHIAETGRINGALLIDFRGILQTEYLRMMEKINTQKALLDEMYFILEGLMADSDEIHFLRTVAKIPSLLNRCAEIKNQQSK